MACHASTENTYYSFSLAFSASAILASAKQQPIKTCKYTIIIFRNYLFFDERTKIVDERKKCLKNVSMFLTNGKGNYTEDSDIDVAVALKDFENVIDI